MGTKKITKSGTGEVVWGCPSCGGIDVFQHVTLNAQQDGTFQTNASGLPTFVERGKPDMGTGGCEDVEDVGNFECGECGDTFDAPARVRHDGTIRISMSVDIQVHALNVSGVESNEEDLGLDRKTHAEFFVEDGEEAKRLVEALSHASGVSMEITKAQVLKD